MVTTHLPAPKRLRAGRLAPRRRGLVRDTEDMEDNFLWRIGRRSREVCGGDTDSP